ncbi:MAG: hypothetical protein ACYDAP_10030 [Thermoplasmataceae archaeon]
MQALRKGLQTYVDSISRKKKVMIAIAFSIIMIVSSIAIFGYVTHRQIQQAPLTGPLTTGRVTFSNSSGIVGSFVSANGKSQAPQEVGNIEAFIATPVTNNTINVAGISHRSNNYIQIGSTQLSPNGFFNMSLNYSFYSYARDWVSFLSNMKANSTEISIMYEVNFQVYKNNKTFLYTFPTPYLFSPRVFVGNNNFHRSSFSINKNYVLGQPAEILNGTGGVNYNPQYIKGPGGGGNVIVTTYCCLAWKTTFSNSIKAPLPLIMAYNTTPLNLKGNFVFSAALGELGNSESFSSSNGFTNSTTCINNVKNWHFEASSGGTVSLGEFSQQQSEIPQSVTNVNNNVSFDIYLSNISLEITQYTLFRISVTQEFLNGVLIKQTSSSSSTGDTQYQQEITNDAGKGTTMRDGSFNKAATKLFIGLYANSTQHSYGTLSPSNEIQFTNVTNFLNAGISSAEMQDISNVVEMSISTLGIMAAAAAALSVGPGAATADIAAMVVTITGMAASIMGAMQSVIIAANDTTTIYGAAMTSFYSTSVSASVYLDPSTFQIDGVTFDSASPFIILSQPQ